MTESKQNYMKQASAIMATVSRPYWDYSYCLSYNTGIYSLFSCGDFSLIKKLNEQKIETKWSESQFHLELMIFTQIIIYCRTVRPIIAVLIL